MSKSCMAIWYLLAAIFLEISQLTVANGSLLSMAMGAVSTVSFGLSVLMFYLAVVEEDDDE